MLFYAWDFIHDDFKENGFFVATTYSNQNKVQGYCYASHLKKSALTCSMIRANRQINSF